MSISEWVDLLSKIGGLGALVIAPGNPLVEPEGLVAIFVLQDAHSLETGQMKDDAQIVKVPHSNYLAFHVELGVTSRGVFKWLRGRDWTKTLIVNCKLKPDTTH